MKTVPERLAALRALMAEHGLTHYLVPSSDEHLNEYLPPWGLRREYLSGFTGSAGDLLVGLEEARLFTDGRYHLQAEEELAGTGITLSKVGAPGHPTVGEHLRALCREGGKKPVAGVDPMVLAAGTGEALARALEAEGGELRPVRPNLVDALWSDRPAPATTPLVAVEPRWAGETPAEKLARVRADLGEAGAEALVVVKLDQLAWLLNLRSRDDVPFNPVFEGYGYLDGAAFHVFLHEPGRRLGSGAQRAVPGLVAHAYGELPAFLEKVRNTRVLLDPTGTTMGVRRLLAAGEGVRLVFGPSPAENAKAVKNEAERQAMRTANRRASAAKFRTLTWLAGEVEAGRTVTERSFLERIEGLYAEMEEFWGLSFNTIAATGANGAIVHYGKAGPTPLREGDLFLIDSGAQVAGGTTDDTRTVAVGRPTEEQRRLYTLVLRAHVAAAGTLFPEGAPGTSLDAICRAPLWREGLTYDHGTGHGVGCFLNVHEGPFALSERERKPFAVNPLRAGMVTSIEPGHYRTGWGGIRLENLYLIEEDSADETGRKWLRFSPLTLIPFDRRLIDPTLLTPSERSWLDRYHARVLEELAGDLAPTEREALARACAPV